MLSFILDASRISIQKMFHDLFIFLKRFGETSWRVKSYELENNILAFFEYLWSPLIPLGFEAVFPWVKDTINVCVSTMILFLEA